MKMFSEFSADDQVSLIREALRVVYRLTDEETVVENFEINPFSLEVLVWHLRLIINSDMDFEDFTSRDFFPDWNGVGAYMHLYDRHSDLRDFLIDVENEAEAKKTAEIDTLIGDLITQVADATGLSKTDAGRAIDALPAVDAIRRMVAGAIGV